jgi:hypothetical protein
MEHKRFSHKPLFSFTAVLVAALGMRSQSALAQNAQATGATGDASLQLALLGFSLAPNPGSSNSMSTAASLPDAPLPQGQQNGKADPGKHTNQFPTLPPGLVARVPLTTQDKLHIYIRGTFGPPSVILPAF